MAPNRTTTVARNVIDGSTPPPIAKLCFQPTKKPGRAPAPAPAPAPGSGHGVGMVRSVSMLEVNDIQDMKRFGAEMDVLAGASPENHGGDDGEDEFLLIDSGHSVAEAEQHPFPPPPSPRPAGAAAAPTPRAGPAAPAATTAGMRRVMSVSSLSTSRANRAHKFGLLSSSLIMRRGLQDGVHTIQEHTDHNEDLGVSTRRGDSDDDSHSVHSKLWVRKNSTGKDSTQAANAANGNGRRPARGLGALRNSLKNSSNSLRRLGSRHSSSNNLRSSGNSFVSAASHLSGFDDTNHSLESESSDEETGDDGAPARPAAAPPPSAVKRNVSFSSLEIRSYRITLGDAPTAHGPAVGLDWEYDLGATEEHRVDDYEADRADRRRSRGEMRMPPAHRQWLLMREAGCTREEIQAATEEARRVARGREKTARGVKLGFVQPMEMAMESTKRRIFRTNA